MQHTYATLTYCITTAYSIQHTPSTHQSSNALQSYSLIPNTMSIVGTETSYIPTYLPTRWSSLNKVFHDTQKPRGSSMRNAHVLNILSMHTASDGDMLQLPCCDLTHHLPVREPVVKIDFMSKTPPISDTVVKTDLVSKVEPPMHCCKQTLKRPKN